MASGTFYPGVSGDDAECSAFDASKDWVTIGYDASNPKDVSCRFPSVTIPPGSTINSAYLHAFTYTERTGTVYSNIYANDVDNAVAPTSEPEFNALVKTTAFVAWDTLSVSNPQGYEHVSPDIAAVIQEVIDRTGWSSGNALQIIWEDDGSAKFAYRMISSFDYDSGNYKMELHIDWTAPVSVYDVCTWNPDDRGTNVSLDATLLIASHD